MNDTKAYEFNPLAVQKIPKLLTKFAVPSVIAMLVNALYNIVDQIFIGNGIGYLGNAATNVAFPFTTIALAIALLLGQGGASKQNLSLGAKNRDDAEKAVGNAVFCAAAVSVTLLVVFQIFLPIFLILFGATPDVYPYALTYSRIIVFGLPFMICGTTLNNIIRADQSPLYSMMSMLIGAVLNTVLDPIFIYVFDWGIAGAAYATIIGQIVSFFFSAAYIFRMKNITFRFKNMRPHGKIILNIAVLGIASFVNQIAMAIVQIVMNNTMTKYGALSMYGPDIPLACAGIMMKVNMIFMSIVIGIAQGSQPIVSFNYGAKNYSRVKKTYLTAALSATAISIIAFAAFQLFPRQITSIFGEGSEEYMLFSVECFRIYLFCTFLNGIQPVTSVFMTSIGKGIKGMFMALTRQLLFLVPLMLIFPIFWGIDGIMYSAPVADSIAFILAMLFMYLEFKNMSKLEKQLKANL
ncbi:MAG: MATE family efflux transporter [Christensenellaceae bacterium]|nr:MATE family efflux transporter [Christensenellaceae bacterium]